ncbi:MAG: hypothetical protein AB7T10_00955 [bacterium]
MAINNFNLSIEKIIIGYYKELSYYYSQILLNNNFDIYEKNYGYLVNFKYDFWGVGIGWGKKYKVWKELYIEPMLNYKFIYTFDFESGCITGFIGGLGIGYSF